MIPTEFKMHVLTTVRDIGDDFEENDDDWAPVLLVLGENENALMPLPMATELEKDICAYILIPTVIRETKAQACAFVTSTWYIEEKKREGETKEQVKERMQSSLPPSMRPDRMEAVFVLFAAKGGSFEAWNAIIERDGVSPPTLGEWRIWPGDVGLWEGRFLDPIVAAFNEEE